MNTWLACPQCGWPEIEIPEAHHQSCPRCFNQGHISHPMSPFGLLDSADQFQNDDLFDGVAVRHKEIALNLVRHATLMECARVASNEYAEAQREGLDAHAAWQCAYEAITNLDKCNCGYSHPYGFVSEAGCEYHDTA